MNYEETKKYEKDKKYVVLVDSGKDRQKKQTTAEYSQYIPTAMETKGMFYSI